MFVYLLHSSGVAYTLSNILLSNTGRKENHSPLHWEPGSQFSVWNNFERSIYRHPETQVYKAQAECLDTVHASGDCYIALKSRKTAQKESPLEDVNKRFLICYLWRHLFLYMKRSDWDPTTLLGTQLTCLKTVSIKLVLGFTYPYQCNYFSPQSSVFG